jgi:hypothetical protein
MTSKPAPSSQGLIRVATFRVPEDNPNVHAEIRGFDDPRWGRARWVGRRLMDDAAGPEIVSMTLWDTEAAMERAASDAQSLLSPQLRASAAAMQLEIYACRAYGAWKRSAEPMLLRVFRGSVVEGEQVVFDDAAAASYLRNFSDDVSCASAVAGVRNGTEVLLASLWTDWDAVVRATAGDVRQILPFRLPPWAVSGSAAHYEILAVTRG